MAEDEKTSKESEEEEKVDEIIADFKAISGAKEQRKKFARTLAEVNDRIKNFNVRKRIEFQIKFIRAINHYILTAVSETGLKYVAARSSLIGLIAFLDAKLYEGADFYAEANDGELASTQRLIDTLLQGLQENIELKEADAGELEVHITLISTSIAQVIGAVKERVEVKEAGTIGNLETRIKSFRKKSKNYKNISYVFLGGSLAIMSLLALLAYLQFCVYLPFCNYTPQRGATYLPPMPDRDYLYFHLALETIFSLNTLLSITLLAILFASIRFYAANNHNAVVCDQRADTLGLYEALRNSATEGEERKLVLQKILDVATDHQPSGFVKESKSDDSLVEKALATASLIISAGSGTSKK